MSTGMLQSAPGGGGGGSGILFACSKCYSRHPFEELSSGQQLCKECRGSYPVVKCTYCRSEFQQDSKSSTSSVCKKCDHNLRNYGKPNHCAYCTILAAFIGSKCQRCTNAEKKYGPPKTCEQCKLQCAFGHVDRHDEERTKDKDGKTKILCWLCTVQHKRTAAKTKQTDPGRHSYVKLSSNSRVKEHKKVVDKRPQRVDVTKLGVEDGGPSPSKHSRSEHKKPIDESSNSLNVASSDHLVQTTMLKEQIANLQREISKKDKELLAKDRDITQLKAQNFTNENDFRNKLKDTQRAHDSKVDALNNRIKLLQKEVASLSKNVKNKSSLTIIRSSIVQENSRNNSSGGEDSN